MWIEVFKSGIQTDSLGASKEFSAENLQEIADIYNLEIQRNPNYSAPLVKGHPQTDSPAYGWIERLARRGSSLYAKLQGLTAEIIRDIEQQKFKKVSIALYPDNLLKHIGLLGAAQPALKDLDNVKFNDDNISYDFLLTENTNLKNHLRNTEIQFSQSEYIQFSDKLIQEKKILTPSNKSDLINILKASASVKLNDSTLDKHIMQFIDSLEFIDFTAEINPIRKIDEKKFSGNLDERRLEIHNATLELMQSIPELSYAEAAEKAFSEFTFNIF